MKVCSQMTTLVFVRCWLNSSGSVCQFWSQIMSMSFCWQWGYWIRCYHAFLLTDLTAGTRLVYTAALCMAVGCDGVKVMKGKPIWKRKWFCGRDLVIQHEKFNEMGWERLCWSENLNDNQIYYLLYFPGSCIRLKSCNSNWNGRTSLEFMPCSWRAAPQPQRMRPPLPYFPGSHNSLTYRLVLIFTKISNISNKSFPIDTV